MSGDDKPKNPDESVFRQELIQKAVKFLTDDRVANTPFEEKRSFLKNKGLNDNEINEAISIASRLPSCSRNDSSLLDCSVQATHSAPIDRNKWRDFANFAVLAGGATYLTVSLIKNVIMPKWFGGDNVERLNIQNIQDSVSDVQNGLKFLVDSVQQTLCAVQKQQELSDKLLQQLSLRVNEEDVNARLERQMAELKSEISIVKGLFLSRDQFPSAPLNKPSLPTWQQLASSHDRFDNGDNFTSNSARENHIKNGIFENGKDENDEEDDLNKSIPLNTNERMTPV